MGNLGSGRLRRTQDSTNTFVYSQLQNVWLAPLGEAIVPFGSF